MTVNSMSFKVNKFDLTRKLKTLIEFLRFLYCGQVDRNFSKFGQLISLADKYVQEDLYDKCINILIHKITPNTFCEILDLARENDLPILQDWCMKLLPNRLSKKTITQLIKYLQHEENENFGMEEIVLNFVLINLSEILEECNSKEEWRFYADFLLPYISKERIARFTDLFKGKIYQGEIPVYLLSEEMAHLRDAIFHFVFTNFREKVEHMNVILTKTFTVFSTNTS